MKPPRTFLAATETALAHATGDGALLRVGENLIDDVCPAPRKAALMHASAPVYVFPSNGFRCEERRRVELDRGKKRLQTKANYVKPAEQTAPSPFEVTKTY